MLAIMMACQTFIVIWIAEDNDYLQPTLSFKREATTFVAGKKIVVCGRWAPTRKIKTIKQELHVYTNYYRRILKVTAPVTFGLKGRYFRVAVTFGWLK